MTHDDLVSALRRVQADAIEIIEKADMRLAEEHTAGQERGEIATQGRGGANIANGVSGGNAVATAADLGMTRKQTFQARQLLKAEAIEPGIVRRALDDQPALG